MAGNDVEVSLKNIKNKLVLSSDEHLPTFKEPVSALNTGLIKSILLTFKNS